MVAGVELKAAALAFVAALLMCAGPHNAVAQGTPEQQQARKDIDALKERLHKVRSAYVRQSARFFKSHRSNPLAYLATEADDAYEGALGTQGHYIGALGNIGPDSAYQLKNLGTMLGKGLRVTLQESQDYENAVIAKYDAAKGTNLSKSDRACYERAIAAAGKARSVHEETILLAARYLTVFGGRTMQYYVENEQRIEAAQREFYAQREEQRALSMESASAMLLIIVGVGMYGH